ncbi:MAG: T9SS type A sorting domain-containing protein [Bacteroidia bacterium]|nr:T9SS type A sorting domain-containing protein [Bacteroidia bacterium]
MKKAYLLFTLLFCMLRVLAQNPNNWDTAWICSYGGPNIDYAKDVKETPDGGFIIAGTTGSFGNGQTSFYLIKTDSIGQHQWSRALGTNQNDLAYSVELANDGGYFIAGSSNGNAQSGYDAYLVKTDKNGIEQWSKNYGGSDWDFIYNSCKMPDGGLVLCGETYSGTNGIAKTYALRLDAAGTVMWSKTLGGKAKGKGSVVKRSGNCLFIAGKLFDTIANKYNAAVYKLDFSGNLIKQNVLSGNTLENLSYNDLCITRYGTLFLCGARTSDTSNHCVLNQMDTSNLSSIYYMTNNIKQHFNSITEGKNSEVYVVGSSLGNVSGQAALCLRYDSVLTQLSYDFYDGKYDEEAFKIIRTKKGFGMVGYTTTYGNYNTKIQNAFLVVLNKHFMPNNHYVLVNEFQDDLSPVSVRSFAGINAFGIVLAPNPVKDKLHLRYNTPQFETINKVIIRNMFGETVLQQCFEHNGSRIIEMQLGDLSNGLYFVEIYDNQGNVASKKIVVESSR